MSDEDYNKIWHQRNYTHAGHVEQARHERAQREIDQAHETSVAEKIKIAYEIGYDRAVQDSYDNWKQG